MGQVKKEGRMEMEERFKTRTDGPVLVSGRERPGAAAARAVHRRKGSEDEEKE
jgi:hypothetical protein